MSEFLVRMRGDHLAPEIQAGDALQVRKQDHADEGALAVVVVDGNEAAVCRYDPAEGKPVAGVVTWVLRRVP